MPAPTDKRPRSMYRRDYMRRSLQASLAMVLVQSRPLVALVVIVPLLGVTVSSVVAVASTVAAVGVLSRPSKPVHHSPRNLTHNCALPSLANWRRPHGSASSSSR